MPLYEIETDGHIVIAWGEDQKEAEKVFSECYPTEKIVRVTKRPRNVWVISKALLGLPGTVDRGELARECLSKAAGDKIHAIRLFIQETGVDLEEARRIIESNMSCGR